MTRDRGRETHETNRRAPSCLPSFVAPHLLARLDLGARNSHRARRSRRLATSRDDSRDSRLRCSVCPPPAPVSRVTSRRRPPPPRCDGRASLSPTSRLSPRTCRVVRSLTSVPSILRPVLWLCGSLPLPLPLPLPTASASAPAATIALDSPTTRRGANRRDGAGATGGPTDATGRAGANDATTTTTTTTARTARQPRPNGSRTTPRLSTARTNNVSQRLANEHPPSSPRCRRRATRACRSCPRREAPPSFDRYALPSLGRRRGDRSIFGPPLDRWPARSDDLSGAGGHSTVTHHWRCSAALLF